MLLDNYTFSLHIHHHSDNMLMSCQLISTWLTLEKRVLLSPDRARMGSEYYPNGPNGLPQPIRAPSEITSCAMNLRTSFFCCRWPYSLRSLQIADIFLILTVLILFFLKYFLPTHGYMCIAHTGLVLVCLCVFLGHFCFLFHSTCLPVDHVCFKTTFPPL